MAEIIISESAWEDLDGIADYIAKDSPRYAVDFTERLLEATLQIITHPESGRRVPEFASPVIRELIFGNYRIIYGIENPEYPVVLRFIHAARLFP